MCASLQLPLLKEGGAGRQGSTGSSYSKELWDGEEKVGSRGDEEVDREADPLTECQVSVLKLRPSLRAQKKAGLHNFSFNTCSGVLTVCRCSMHTDEGFTLTEETEAHRQVVSHPGSHSLGH